MDLHQDADPDRPAPPPHSGPDAAPSGRPRRGSQAEDALEFLATAQDIEGPALRIQALGILYEAERLSMNSISTSILTTTVALLTYIGVLGGFLSSMEDISSLTVPYLALPAWGLGVFFVIQLGQLQAHGRSVRIIEAHVVAAAGLSPQARFVGTGAERRWTKLASATPSTFVFYLTFFLSLVIVTGVTFGKVLSHYHYWPWTLTVAVVVYALLTTGIAVALAKLVRVLTHPELDVPDPED